jgi:mono/diheme cytochrome c family protein
MRQKETLKCAMGLFALALLAPSTLSAQAAATPSNKGFTTIKEIFQTSCSSCHDWTDSYDAIVGGGHIVPNAPEQSVIYQKISDDSMPASGDKLTNAQKALIRAWILAGAPQSDRPIPVPETGAAAPAVPSSVLPSSASVTPPPSQGFLFFPSKVAFHKATGFTSTALFFGAGILGVVHFADMMTAGHTLRDNLVPPFGEGGPESVRIPLVQQAWAGDSTIRWVHVGFVAGGELLYLGDAITGLSMLTKHQPGKLTRSDIHRYAFFAHVTLMAAQIALGLFETYALSQGNHDVNLALGAAHAAIGLTIPLVMLGAGLENTLLKE